MAPREAVRIPRTVLAGVALLTLLRLAIAAVLPLGDDETFYWEWSRHLAPGYLDQPPAIAWLIHASTAVFGNTAFAVHLVAAMLLAITSLALWTLAREVTGRGDAATLAVALFNVIPVFAAGGLLAVPDGPLGLAWVLTLLWSWRAANGVPSTQDLRPPSRPPVPSTQDLRPPSRPPVPSRSRLTWLYAGLWLGLALDSKYTAAVLPISVGLWLILSSHRDWLRRPWPYAGLAVAAVLFAPVLWWNATHHWASFYFTLERRPGWSAGPNAPVFLGLQFVYLAPLLFPWLIWALVVAARRGLLPPPRGDAVASRRLVQLPLGNEAWLFLAAAGVPVIVGVAAASLVGAAKGHWAAPGYMTATIALAALIVERPWQTRPRAWQFGIVAGIASAVFVTVLTHALPVISAAVLPPRLDPTVDYYGWPAAAPKIAAVARRDAHRPFFITSDRYQVLAQFDFSTGGRYLSTSVTGNDQYVFWTRWSDLRGRDGLFIQDGRYPPDVDLRQGCGVVEPGPTVPVVRRGVVVRTLDLVWCRNFWGRPIPPLR